MRKLIMFFAVIGVMLSLESQAQHAAKSAATPNKSNQIGGR